MEGNKYVNTEQSFGEWLLTNDLSQNYLSNEAGEAARLLEFEGSKVIYENNPAIMYTFHDISNAQKCESPHITRRCDSNTILTNLAAKLNALVPGLQGLLEILGEHEQSEKQGLLEAAKTAVKWIHHITHEATVRRANNT